MQAHKFLTRGNPSGFVPTYVKTLELSCLIYCKKKKRKKETEYFEGLLATISRSFIFWSQISMSIGHSKYLLPTVQEKSLHMDINIKIRLIRFFAAKDGEALQSLQKQDREQTVVQIMSSLLPNSDLNQRK